MDARTRAWSMTVVLLPRHLLLFGALRSRATFTPVFILVFNACFCLCGRIAHAQTPTTVSHSGVGDTGGAGDQLSRPITLTLTRVSLKQALDSVSHVARILIQYQTPLVERYVTPITIRVDRTPIGIVLERILDGTKLRVVPDRQGFLYVMPDAESGTDSVPTVGTLTGRVVDSATGRELPGVAVKVVGTKLSTVTVNQGDFTLHNVPVGDQTLATKLFGYRPSEIEVTISDSIQKPLRFRLVAVPNVLSGVVTTAVGVQDRKTVGSDITVIKVDSVIKTAPIKNVTDLLDGRVPGLTVQHTSGVPGAPSRIRIRGITGGLPGGSTSNDPIVIIDGIRVYAQSSGLRDQNNAAGGKYTAPAGLDQIDPNSIESLEVLKGPSAAAQYGPDGANGVIVITTKHGRAGPAQLSSSFDAGVSYLPGVYAGPGFYSFGHGIYAPGVSYQCGGIGDFSGTGMVSSSGPLSSGDGGVGQCLRDSLVLFQALNIPRLSTFALGTTKAASVTASGGASTLQYSLTATATSDLGYLKMPALYQDQYRIVYDQAVPDWMKRPDNYRTWSVGGNFNSAPLPGVLASFNTSLTTSDSRTSSAQGSIKALSGVYIDTTVLQSTAIGSYTQQVTSHTVTSNNALQVGWNGWKWLTSSLVVGQSVSDREDHSIVPYGFLGPLSSTDLAGTYAYTRPTTSTQTMNVNGVLFPTGRVVTNVGLNFTRTSNEDFSGTAAHLSDGVSVPSAFTSGTQGTSALVSAGWFVAPRLNLGDRFFFSPGFRLDNNGAAGDAGGNVRQRLSQNPVAAVLTQWRQIFTSPGTYVSNIARSLLPQTSFSWIAVDRTGRAPMAGFLTLLRPRVAFGVSGTQPTIDQTLRVISPGVRDSVGHISYDGVQVVSVGNPDLRPERSQEIEGGFDADLWGNRLSLTATQSLKVTKDQITSIPLAPSVGSSSLTQLINVGNTRNTSTELTITATPILNRSMSWTVNANFTVVRNTLVKLNGTGTAMDLGNGLRLVAGYPLDGRWDRPIIGYTAPPAGQKLGASNIFVGDSVAYLGHAQPSFTLPFHSTASFWGGRLSISADWDYENGVTQFDSGNTQLLTNLYLDPAATLGEQAAVVAAYCNTVPSDGEDACARSGTSYGLIQTVSVLRLRSMSVNVELPQSWSRRFHVPRMSVALQGSNLGLWTNYRGKDPDVNGTPVGEAIRDDGQEPLPRTLNVNVRIGN